MKSPLTGLSMALFFLLLFSCNAKEDSLRELRNNWQAYIHHAASIEYSYARIGGIQPFDIPVENNTDYIIDDVVVSIDYIKAAGGIFKTEKVSVYNIPPHSTKTVMAPKSPRGTSVEINITGVQSRDIRLCYPGRGIRGVDPYLCE